MNKLLPKELIHENIDNKHLFFNPYSGGYIVTDEVGSGFINDYKGDIKPLLDKYSQFFGADKNKTKKRLENYLEKLDNVRMFQLPEKNDNHIKPPQSSIIEITSGCNLRCKTCYVNSSTPGPSEMNTKEIKNVVDQLTDLGVKNISIIGGEPLIRKDLYEIVKYVTEKNIVAGISTNGTLLKDEFVKKISLLNNIWVQVSLDGSTAEIHDLNRGKGAFKKAMSGISLLKKYNIPFPISSVIMKSTAKDVGSICDLASSLGARSIIFHKMHLCGRAAKHKEFIPKSEELIYAMTTILNKGIEYKGKLFIELPHNRVFSGCNRVNAKYIGCHFGRFSVYINSKGDITSCSHLQDGAYCFGNIRKDNIRDVWYGSKGLDKLRNLTVNDIESCSNCNYKYACRGSCRAEAYYTNGSIKSSCPDCDALKMYYNTVFQFLLSHSKITSL